MRIKVETHLLPLLNWLLKQLMLSLLNGTDDIAGNVLTLIPGKTGMNQGMKTPKLTWVTRLAKD